MLTHSPCDYYLKYLVTHPGKYANEHIRTLVKLQKLDFLGARHLDKIRKDCVPPTPFYPEKKTHHPSQRFLRKEKIYSLYHRDDDSICAMTILDNAKYKELVETMILSEAEPSWICGALKKQGFKATPKAIKMFEHYFFNIGKMDQVQINALFEARTGFLELDKDDPDERLISNGHHKAAKYSSQSLTAYMAIKPFAKAMNLMRLGYMPDIDIGRVLSMGRTAAALRTVDSVMAGKSKSAVDYGMTTKMLSEIMENIGDVGADLNDAIMRMTLQQDTTTIPTIEELSGGDYTQDLLPIEAEGESVED
jgi:hypothetical protein